MVSAVARQHEKRAELVGEQVGEEAVRLLEKTITDTSASGTLALADAKPTYAIETSVSLRRGASVKVRILVKGDGGKPHQVWHWLNFGTADRIQTSTSPPIPERFGTRTNVGNLFTDDFKGYTGDYFVIPAGTFVHGIEPRRWYDVTNDELKVFLSKKYRRWKVKTTKINEP